MGKKKYVCKGCKRIDWLPDDKLALPQKIEAKNKANIYMDILRFMNKNEFNPRQTRIMKGELQTLMNFHELFTDLIVKYGRDQFIGVIFMDLVYKINDIRQEKMIPKITKEMLEKFKQLPSIEMKQIINILEASTKNHVENKRKGSENNNIKTN